MNDNPQLNPPHSIPRSPRIESVPVLVVLHPDGFVECFGYHHVDVRVVIMPAMDSPSGEAIAEDYLTMMLPPRHRSIYMPGYLRAMGSVRTVTAQDIADQRMTLALMRTIDTLTAVNRDEVTTWIL